VVKLCPICLLFSWLFYDSLSAAEAVYCQMRYSKIIWNMTRSCHDHLVGLKKTTKKIFAWNMLSLAGSFIEYLLNVSHIQLLYEFNQQDTIVFLPQP
jgi:hypothetical protein